MFWEKSDEFKYIVNKITSREKAIQRIGKKADSMLYLEKYMLDASRRMFYELAKKQRRAYEHERVLIYIDTYVSIYVQGWVFHRKWGILRLSALRRWTFIVTWRNLAAISAKRIVQHYRWTKLDRNDLSFSFSSFLFFFLLPRVVWRILRRLSSSITPDAFYNGRSL